MNKRIKVLAEQATTRIDPIAHDGACWDFDQEKFAELIVREMCEVMKAESEGFDLVGNFGAVQGIDVCMRKVKTHFGVEE